MTKEDLRCSCSPPRTFPVKRKWDFHFQDRHAIFGKMNIVNKAGGRETFELKRVDGVITCPRCNEPFEKKMNLRRHLMREDCLTEKRPEIFNPRPPRATRSQEKGSSRIRNKSNTRNQGTRSSKRQAQKAEEKEMQEEDDDDNDDDDDDDEDEDDEDDEDENENEEDREKEEEEEEVEEEVRENTDDLMEGPYYTEEYPYMFRTTETQDFLHSYNDVPVASTRRPTLAMEFTHDTGSRNGTRGTHNSSSPSSGSISLAEHERVILAMQVAMKKMERIIEIQAGQIERLEDTAADYIVFRDRLASLFGRGE
ncbi:hypothetical protein CPC16_004797 [Podila verticillata]|nr:hypothetical protein BGZ59_001000 [Podila verticillata]KAF9396142.1 hypothetical protein CPC16_004797 [Podila verticillata]KAI9235174.1 MAG: hypothetical protein BYD32DRAFT_421768 [Podila humilis]KFH66838.1 hypothetical protein MVEG_07363 [Podila verticillata NRRL 6337]